MIFSEVFHGNSYDLDLILIFKIGFGNKKGLAQNSILDKVD